MADPRIGLPPDKTVEAFNQAAQNHCMEDIQAALKKWKCVIIFQQMHRNGMPCDAGQYVVVRNLDENNLIETVQ